MQRLYQSLKVSATLLFIAFATACGSDSDDLIEQRRSLLHETVVSFNEAIYKGDVSRAMHYLHPTFFDQFNDSDATDREIMEELVDMLAQEVIDNHGGFENVERIRTRINEDAAVVEEIVISFSDGEEETEKYDETGLMSGLFSRWIFEDDRWYLVGLESHENAFVHLLPGFTAQRFVSDLFENDNGVRATAYVPPHEITPEVSAMMRAISNELSNAPNLPDPIVSLPGWKSSAGRGVNEERPGVVRVDLSIRYPYPTPENENAVVIREVTIIMRDHEGLWYVDLNRFALRPQDLLP